jgi:hypothetical protein
MNLNNDCSIYFLTLTIRTQTKARPTQIHTHTRGLLVLGGTLAVVPNGVGATTADELLI